MSRIAFVVEPKYRSPTFSKSDESNIKIYFPLYMRLVSTALIKKGHTVDIYSNVKEDITQNGVRFKPISSDKNKNKADLVVVHNSAKDLSLFTFKHSAVWQHNRTSLVKSWKSKELFSLWRFRPDVICLSMDALNSTPNWLSYRKKHLIPHAIQDEYFSASNSSVKNRSLKAYFASRPSRNLDFLIRSWENHVYPYLPLAELIICCPENSKPFPFDTERLKKSNIHFVGSLNQKDLIELGCSSRMLCYPGHLNETGCRVALDAIGLGLPIISCGIGSLKDLVFHNKTGFIEKSEKAFAKRVIECMTNDTLWKNMSQAALQHPWRQSYDQNTLLWESAFDLK